MKKFILTVIAMSGAFLLSAQDFIDNALLFSRVRPGGSARIQGMGSAQTALGGDYSSALSNPAGLGMFNRSEFTITPALTFHNVTSDYFGSGMKDSKSVFNVPGLSLVLHTPSRSETGFLGGAFSISLTRINDLNQDYRFAGRNPNNSIVDYFMADAGDINPDELLFNGSYFYSLTGLAYNNYLIEDVLDDDGNTFYDSKLLFTSGLQEEVSQRKGSQNQWSIAYGANFDDKFFVGATIGINSLRYTLNQVYSESDFDYPADADQALNDFRMVEDYDIRGTGVNFAVGGIYRPVDFFQFGLSYTTPTFYTVTDTYKARLESNWNNYDYYPDNTGDENLNDVSEEFDQPLLSDYSLTTPMKVSTGIAFISSIGLISADVDFVNYSKARYKSDVAGDFSGDNDIITEEYKKAINYRLGAEYRFDAFRVRGGVGLMADPVAASENTNRNITSFSGGVGYRTKTFYVDLAAVYSQTKGSRIPYYASTVPVAEQRFNTSNYLLTVGFLF